MACAPPSWRPLWQLNKHLAASSCQRVHCTHQAPPFSSRRDSRLVVSPHSNSLKSWNALCFGRPGVAQNAKAAYIRRKHAPGPRLPAQPRAPVRGFTRRRGTELRRFFIKLHYRMVLVLTSLGYVKLGVWRVIWVWRVIYTAREQVRESPHAVKFEISEPPMHGPDIIPLVPLRGTGVPSPISLKQSANQIGTRVPHTEQPPAHRANFRLTQGATCTQSGSQ